MTKLFHFGAHPLDLDTPRLMAVLNITPDSFSDGGRLYKNGSVDYDSIFREAETAVANGADLLDVGGESTRPGATKVESSEEVARVLPVLEKLAERFDTVLSVDTSNPEIMRELNSIPTVGLINDVRALSREGALEAARDSGLAVCLMHMQGEPDTMQTKPEYNSVIEEVNSFLLAQIEACEQKGIPRSKILIDPGFGFGKADEHNLELLRNLNRLEVIGSPILVGLSRKSMIGRLLDRPLGERLAGSLALAMIALHRGANIIRAHDVKETADVIKLFGLVNKLGNAAEY